MNEFTIAFEDEKPIGVLEGCGGTSEMIHEIIKQGHRGSGKIIYDSDPIALVERLIELIDKDKVVPISKEDYARANKAAKRRG